MPSKRWFPLSSNTLKRFTDTQLNTETDMKYTISLEYLYHTSVEVEADSFEDAVEKAINDPQIGSVPEHDLEDPQPTYAVREDGKERYDF